MKTVINLPRRVKCWRRSPPSTGKELGSGPAVTGKPILVRTHLDLAELKASQVLLLARATAGNEAAELASGLPVADRIEQEAQEAETEAGIALALASNGQLREALLHAQQACAIESEIPQPN